VTFDIPFSALGFSAPGDEGMDAGSGLDVGHLTRAFGQLERSLDCYNWVLMNNFLQPKGAL
jgi:hypothetical protein